MTPRSHSSLSLRLRVLRGNRVWVRSWVNVLGFLCRAFMMRLKSVSFRVSRLIVAPQLGHLT